MLVHTRARGSTIFHSGGTCMMAPSANPMAVVDHELRVHGLSSLRVADASIMPTAVSGTGRDDIYGVGLPMSVANDTRNGFEQFMEAFEANYVTREGKLVIDDPEIRHRLIRAMNSYTAIASKNCTPPDAVTWGNIDNN
jgi:hypothetical protein